MIRKATLALIGTALVAAMMIMGSTTTRYEDGSVETIFGSYCIQGQLCDD